MYFVYVGPLVGYLGFKFGVRTVSAFGALIGAVAVGACFFAESITLVTYLYGVFFGMYHINFHRNHICALMNISETI